MGDVILVFRIMPKPDLFDRVKAEIEALKPDRLEEEPIAFGLKALKLTKVVPDESGGVEAFEKQLESIDGIDSVENVMTTRSL